MSDDESVDDPRPAYAAGLPTIEEQVSPFRDPAPSSETIPDALPSGTLRQLHDPAIRSKAPTGGLSGAAPVLVPPRIINAPDGDAIPSSGDVLPLDGVTQPDGLPRLAPSDPWAQPAGPGSQPSLELDGFATNPYAGLRAQGAVPVADAPTVQISKSLELDVAQIGDAPTEAAVSPGLALVRRRVAEPTEVMLPVLRKKQAQQKERSDAWLLVGLVVLAVLIFGLLGAVIVGVLQRMS